MEKDALIFGILVENYLILLCIMGWIAYMIGQSLASQWRTWQQAIPYCLLLSCSNNFLIHALFEGELLSFSAFLVTGVVLITVACVSYRVCYVKKMTTQYWWLYEKTSPLQFCKKESSL